MCCNLTYLSRQERLFSKARMKLKQELDVVALLKKIRRFEALELSVRRLNLNIDTTGVEVLKVEDITKPESLDMQSNSNILYEADCEDTKRSLNKNVIELPILRSNGATVDSSIR